MESREFKPADLDALLAFYGRFEPKRAAQGLPPAGPERIATWLRVVLAGPLHKLAFREESLIGHAFVTATKKPGIGEYAVFLHQDLRGRGLGTELNREVVETARRRGMRGLWLTVEPHNRAAIRSYEKVGFGFVPATVYSTEVEMEILF
jgi:ribosomal protein S18 acetylase RimI-like enzyme